MFCPVALAAGVLDRSETGVGGSDCGPTAVPRHLQTRRPTAGCTSCREAARAPWTSRGPRAARAVPGPAASRAGLRAKRKRRPLAIKRRISRDGHQNATRLQRGPGPGHSPAWGSSEPGPLSSDSPAPTRGPRGPASHLRCPLEGGGVELRSAGSVGCSERTQGVALPAEMAPGQPRARRAPRHAGPAGSPGIHPLRRGQPASNLQL